MNGPENIKTIAPFLADQFVDLDEPIFNIEKYIEFLTQNEKRLGLYKKYLVCKLHDSRIITISRQPENFKITLNDFSTYVFAAALIEKFKLSIDADNISFPLTIDLKGNLSVDFYSVNETGALKEIKPFDLDEYLYEQVTKIDRERIEIAFHFWKSNVKIDKQGEGVIVLASAQHLTLTENQDYAWKELFGNVYAKHYEYFKEQFNTGRYVSDFHECLKLIDEFEQRKEQGTPH
jgi:hypothetical protein